MRIKNLKYSRLYIYIFALFFLNLSASGCTVHTESETNLQNTLQEKSFNTSPGKNFVLKTSVGDVVIKTSDDPVVHVKILGSEDTYKKLHITFKNTDDGVSIIAKKKDSWNIFNFWKNTHLKYEITLPSKYNANIATSGGDINVSDLTGSSSLHTSGGDVSLRNINGPVEVKTSGGDISSNNTSGTVDLKTSGGDINAVAFNGDLNASTSGGDIVLRGSDSKIKASTSGGEISLKYSGQNKGINLYSSGGDIEIHLPSDFQANARLSTSGGSVSCKFKANDVEEMSSHKLIGKFNNGGEPLVVKTSGGDIEIK